MEGSFLAPDGHLSTEAISRFLRGDTEPLQDATVREHMQTCKLCSDLIQDLGRLLEKREAC